MAIFLHEHIKYLRSLDRTQRSFLMGNLMLYVFRGCHQSDVRLNLEKRNLKFDFLTWRRHLKSNGTLLRDGKLYLYALAAKDPLKQSTLDLTKVDLYLLDLALSYRPLKAHLTFLAKGQERPVMTPRSFDRFVAKVLSSEDLVTYTRKFINKKMKFIMKSYDQELLDIEHTLKACALYGLQRSYPSFEHLGHGIAIAKTLIKRNGINFIQEMTTKKKDQLLHDEATDTYSKRTVSMDAIADGTGQFLTADGTFVHRSLLVVGLGGSSTVEGIAWDTLHALKQLQNSSALKNKQREFLKLMLGTHSEAFSDFLGRQNDELLESIPYTTYTKLVCAFLRIPHDAASEFLANLRPSLGGNDLTSIHN